MICRDGGISFRERQGPVPSLRHPSNAAAMPPACPACACRLAAQLPGLGKRTSQANLCPFRSPLLHTPPYHTPFPTFLLSFLSYTSLYNHFSLMLLGCCGILWGIKVVWGQVVAGTGAACTHTHGHMPFLHYSIIIIHVYILHMHACTLHACLLYPMLKGLEPDLPSLPLLYAMAAPSLFSLPLTSLHIALLLLSVPFATCLKRKRTPILSLSHIALHVHAATLHNSSLSLPFSFHATLYKEKGRLRLCLSLRHTHSHTYGTGEKWGMCVAV